MKCLSHLFLLFFAVATLGCDNEGNESSVDTGGGDLVAPDYVDQEAGDPIVVDDADGEQAEPPGAVSTVGEPDQQADLGDDNPGKGADDPAANTEEASER